MYINAMFYNTWTFGLILLTIVYQTPTEKGMKRKLRSEWLKQRKVSQAELWLVHAYMLDWLKHSMFQFPASADNTATMCLDIRLRHHLHSYWCHGQFTSHLKVLILQQGILHPAPQHFHQIIHKQKKILQLTLLPPLPQMQNLQRKLRDKKRKCCDMPAIPPGTYFSRRKVSYQ